MVYDRFTLKPLYPIIFICTSRIEIFLPFCTVWNPVFFLSQAFDAKASEEPIYACWCAGWPAACVISSVEAYVNTKLKPRSLCQVSLLQELYLWAASFVLEFSCCVSRFCPHSLPVNNTVATKVKTRYPFMFTVPRYITAKRD
jgi:hypothetical protein